jgi:uncharacterized membrane protein
MKDEKVLVGAATLGAIAGMRAMSAPALVSQLARKGGLAVEGSKLGFLNSSGALSTTALLAVGELIADKLPFIPSRTTPGPLIARAISGGVSGAIISSARRKSPWAGALIGAGAAIGAAYAAYHLRRAAKERLRVPDFVLALAEDALVASAGTFVARRLSAREA